MPLAFTVNNANWGSAEWVDTGGFTWRAVVQARDGYYIKAWRVVARTEGYGEFSDVDDRQILGYAEGAARLTSDSSSIIISSFDLQNGYGGWNTTVTEAWVEFAPVGDAPGPVADRYTVSVSAAPSGGGSVSGGGAYAAGATCTVAATAAAGWRFLRWTENGSTVSAASSYTFAVASNRTLVAVFEEIGDEPVFSVVLEASPEVGGGVSGGGTFDSGALCTAVATPLQGFVFVRWTEDGETVSTAAAYAFRVSDDRRLVAEFASDGTKYKITFNREGLYGQPASVSPVTGGTQTIRLKYGDPWPDIEPPAAVGYDFKGYYTAGPSEITGVVDPHAVKWYESDGSPTNERFLQTGDMTLDALWEARRYDLTVNPNGGFYPGGRYPYGTFNDGNVPTTIARGLTFGSPFNNVIAIPRRPGFVFLGWYSRPGGGDLVYAADPDAELRLHESEPWGNWLDVPGAKWQAGTYWRASPSSPQTGIYVHDGPLTVYARWSRIPTHLILRGSSGAILRGASNEILRDD